MRPDIRTITGLVPPSGNLVQGQSELAVSPDLAAAACRRISASENHYSPAEGDGDLRRIVAEKIARFNGIVVDPDTKAQQLLITAGATGALVAISQRYLKGVAALVFEPYYPYHRLVVEELGGTTEVLPLQSSALELDRDELVLRCRELARRPEFPLRAIILCNPATPAGKVFTLAELEALADVCRGFDLICIVDEVYEHHVIGLQSHLSIARLPGMWERTITVNSFSKSWNVSGWRIGYCYGPVALFPQSGLSFSISRNTLKDGA